MYPDTESIRSDIERAATLKTTLKYENLSADFDRIVTEINGNPRFVQVQTKDICIELLKSMTSLGDVNSILNNVDFILFQRIKIPVLCLEKKIASVKVGISAFIELSEIGIKVHKMVDWDGPTVQTLITTFALIFSLYAVFENEIKL